MRRPPLHPACKIFPALGREDLQELADDIAENGLRNPIVMCNAKLLNGRNRWEACKIAKVEPRFTEFDGDDPIGWVVSQNLVRRHLTASQRAVVAFDLLPMLEKEAKQRQRRSNIFHSPCPQLLNNIEDGWTNQGVVGDAIRPERETLFVRVRVAKGSLLFRLTTIPSHSRLGPLGDKGRKSASHTSFACGSWRRSRFTKAEPFPSFSLLTSPAIAHLFCIVAEHRSDHPQLWNQ